MVKLRRCLVGGTFDRFHTGHKDLLNAALEVAELVEVWIVGDEISKSKSAFIQPFEDRRSAILDWADERITTHELTDQLGPAPHRRDCDSIICTPETLPNCNSINEKRLQNGLTPLEIIEVPHTLDDSGSIISSSRIRAGAIDREGNPWLSKPDRENVHYFPNELDAEFKQPFGELYLGPEEIPEVAISAALDDFTAGCLVAVGDVCVAALLDIGVTPDLAMIDGYTKRKELEQKVDISAFNILLEATNPAGQITPSFIDSIAAALSGETSTCIEVDGEEDFGPLIAHMLAPLGTNIVYGQPNQGVVLGITSEELKEVCRDKLSRFEVR